jgi:hypothetical protein
MTTHDVRSPGISTWIILGGKWLAVCTRCHNGRPDLAPGDPELVNALEGPVGPRGFRGYLVNMGRHPNVDLPWYRTGTRGDRYPVTRTRLSQRPLRLPAIIDCDWCSATMIVRKPTAEEVLLARRTYAAIDWPDNQ